MIGMDKKIVGMGCLYYLHVIILIWYTASTLFLSFLAEYHPYIFIHFHEMYFILVSPLLLTGSLYVVYI